MTDKKPEKTAKAQTDQKIQPDPRTDEDWANILKACRSNPNYIHPKEAQALASLKERYPELALHEFWNRFPKDRALYAFLFSRKLDVARTADLLKEHLTYRHDHGFMQEIKPSELDQNVVSSGYAYHVPFKRDMQGRCVMYLFMGRYKPKEYGKGAMPKIQVFLFDYLIRHEGLDCFRFGFTYVEDISGVGLSNMSQDKAEQKQMMKMMEIFPLRIRSILVVEPGIIIRALMRIAKFFVKKKIIQRVECIKREELFTRITAENLIEAWGGKIKFDFKKHWQEQVVKQWELDHKATSSSESGSTETDADGDIDADGGPVATTAITDSSSTLGATVPSKPLRSPSDSDAAAMEKYAHDLEAEQR